MRMRSTAPASLLGEGAHFLSMPSTVAMPALVELVTDIAVEEVLARHLVALGEAQHLAAERGQAAVEAVELIDEIFDLGVVELDRSRPRR